MIDEVCTKLQSKANEEETFLKFIRDSEREFGLPRKRVFSMDITTLNTYIDYLDNLWNK